MMSYNQDELKSKKAELRSILRAKRRSLGDDERRIAALAVAERVIGMDEYAKAELILAYMPARGELDVLPIIQNARENGKRVAFPLCVDNGGLRLLVPNAPDAFSIGTYGIAEPDTARSTEVFANQLDLIIVPAVAFAEDCLRLGQGGGYYDRLLESTNAFTVGVGYDFQLLKNLPVESHDRTLNCVALPSRLIWRMSRSNRSM